jgi:hypothetical protein
LEPAAIPAGTPTPPAEGCVAATATPVSLASLAAPPVAAASPAAAEPVTDVPMEGGDPARTGAMPGPGPAGDPLVRWWVSTGKLVAATPAVVNGVV